ncbi:type II toxin-antitoxin system MqsA family antitoxin [Yersinia intermedia]|uniref:type II toxin-antitoxin system MqsA family antitoxin n=1 Tax=Yersinia intermedia TaxID=631 RepID=UPI0011A1AD41|nr:type II toxin-antitoxin system MqsA family antitoxin [Yersinia intermedia]MCB5315622.1 type II toxin-antitoxin system MqsA family antitoxin [Yersinia intermedia]MCB5329409.1 type II toxin-antitoxin system MqsA family antitoxin [Yersinia intermedia]
MKKNSICPICGEGVLHEKITPVLRTHSGFSKEIPLYSSECNECGSDIATEIQSSKNKRLMTAFYKEAEGLLTGDEIKKIRTKLNIRQADASKIFGGGSNAFSKYEIDDVTQSVAMDKLIRLANSMPEVFSKLSEDAGIVRFKHHVKLMNYLTSIQTLIAEPEDTSSSFYVRRDFSAFVHKENQSSH